MIARRAVWTDERVRPLLARFVSAADEVWHLQHVEGAEGELFRKVAEQGHYAGRTVPTDTRQGIYATTADGALLASVNTNDPERMRAMLTKALAAFDALPAGERSGAASEAPAPRRWERLFPADGLVLRTAVRDVGRERRAEEGDDWRSRAWNRDFAWFRADEARSFLPAAPKAGDRHEVPAELVQRLARLHLVDVARGQSEPYALEHVREARLVAEVLAVEEGLVRVRLEGRARTLQEGSWRTRGLDQGPSTPQARGFDATLLGRATYDLGRRRFTAFELVAVGLRRGATRYNGRDDDLGPAPMGVALVLASDAPADRVAPASIWAYGW